MPVATPIVGKNAKVTFTPSGGSEITIKNAKWTLVKVSNVQEAPNTSDGMVRAAGLPDANGSVEGPIDGTTLITAGIDEGAIGVMKLYLDATKFYTVTAIIGDITIDSNGVNGVETFSFPWMLQSGTVTEPA